MINRREWLARITVAFAAGLRPRARAAETAPPAWRVGIFTRPWDRLDYRAALDAIAEAGFRHVGLMTTAAPRRLVLAAETTPEEAAAVAGEVRQRKLGVLSVYGGESWLKPDADASIAGLKRMIDHCAVCASGNLLMGGTGSADLLPVYLRAIGACAAYAAEKKVHLSLKPHGGLNATAAQCRAMVEKVGHPNFRVWYDPGNILYYSDGQLDPTQEAGALDGLVTGLCVKDFLPPKNVALTPGTGRVDFPAVLARLRRGGFTGGPLVIECLAPGEPPHLLAEARKAREFVFGLVRG